MKFLKFVGWSVIGLLLLSGLAYGLFPTIASMVIANGLTSRGFKDVSVNLDYPSSQALIIRSFAFTTPEESGSTSISIHNTEITYTLRSLLHRMVDTVDIEHIGIIWDSSLLERPSSPSPSVSARQTDSQFDLTSLGSVTPLPVLPFQHLRINHVEISNPLAPPTFQHISMSANINSLQGGYKGTVHIEEDDLPLNRLTFSVQENGVVTFLGTHATTPEDPILSLETSLNKSPTSLMLQGQTTLNLHPLIQTVGVLYPIPSEYQSLTGTFTGTWSGAIHEKPLPSGSTLGPVHGDFAVEVNLPTWPPFAQEIQLFIQGTFSVDNGAMTLVLQPSSTGTVRLSLDSLVPPALDPFISHKGLRSLAWNIRQPVHMVVPITQTLETVQIPSGQIHIAMRNPSEQLDVLLSPQNLFWKPASGLTGNAEVVISTQLKPASTPSLRLRSLSLEANTSIVFSADQIAVTLKPISIFRLSKMSTETLHIPAMEGRFPKGLAWTYQTGQQTWELLAPTSTLALPSLLLQGQQWKFQEISTKDLAISYTPESWVINGELEVKQVRPPFEAIKIPASNWHARYSANPTSITVQFNGQTLLHPLRIGGQARLDLQKNEAIATVTLQPIHFAPQTLVLSQLIQPWGFPEMDITHGSISASIEMTIAKNPTTAATAFHIKRLHGIVDFKDIGGFKKPNFMEGLTTRIEILGEHDTFHIPSTPVRINRIQSVVDIRNTSFILSSGTFQQASVPTLSFTNLSTQLLGGTVTLPQANFDPAQTTHQATLQIQGLDLGEILRLEQQETVQGTGTLDGVLPLFLSGSDVAVHDGSLKARPPGGTLQMEISEATASSWTKSQPNLDLIIQSLQNYQYSKFEVGVDYDKNGILKLTTRLEGKNPDFRNGIPIHFNLNIEENIPALMKSLSLVQGLEDSIEKMMAGTGKVSAKKKKEPSELP